VYLDCGADKDEALAKYKETGCYWIEDKPENAMAGQKVGLNSLLMAHGHNVNYDGAHVRVQNWKEIYEIIVG
jgi:hypothetical protein